MSINIKWTFGWNSKIGLINISTNDKLKIFFVNEQVGIVLEYNRTNNNVKQIETLIGHDYSINSIDASLNGLWLVSASRSKNSWIIIWDSLLNTPIHKISSPNKVGTTIVKFSVDSKYLITVSETDQHGDQTIHLWDLSSEDMKESTCSTILHRSNFDPIIHLTCCYENPKFYCFTTNKLVFFMTLQVENNKVRKLIITVPNKDPKQAKYNYTQSTYIRKFRQVLSASTGGLVSIWDDINYDVRKIKNTSVTNDKKYLKTVKLDQYPITTIICKKYIITGNTNGDIYFYDKSLCVLYHLNKFYGNPITSIAIILDVDINKNKNYTSAIETFGTSAQTQVLNNDLNSKHNHKNNDLNSKHNHNITSTKLSCSEKSRIGTFYTNQQKLDCDTFFISTKNCEIFYVDIPNECYEQVFEKCEGELITAIDAHPKKSRVALGYSTGKLDIYDYYTKKLIANNTVENDLKTKTPNQITCIKHSYNGFYLCYGCTDGSFWFVNPNHLTPIITTAFKWNDSPVQHITISEHSNYVVYTDGLFGIYLYGVLLSEEFNVKYYGCYEVHTGIIRGISITDYKSNLTIYSVGADHRIVIYDFDKIRSENIELVKIMKTESWNEPQCMMKSTMKKELNLIISGNDLRLCVWNDNQCIRTTLGVNLETPIRVLKESTIDKSIIFFCTDRHIGILRQPIDGNPYKKSAVLASGTKLIDIVISWDNKYIFSISENSTSMLMWSVYTRYLENLEQIGGTGLNAYSSLLEGGQNGPEIVLLKEFFYCVQLSNSQNPETTVLKDAVDVCELSYLMRAMGYYPSETELSNMIYEMYSRSEDEINHPKTIMTFEEFVIAYLNYKPQLELKFGEVRQAFDEMMKLGDISHIEREVLTRETFINMMQNKGSKISKRELEIIIYTLLKTTNDISSSNESVDAIYTALPFSQQPDFTQYLLHTLMVEPATVPKCQNQNQNTIISANSNNTSC